MNIHHLKSLKFHSTYFIDGLNKLCTSLKHWNTFNTSNCISKSLHIHHKTSTFLINQSNSRQRKKNKNKSLKVLLTSSHYLLCHLWRFLLATKLLRIRGDGKSFHLYRVRRETLDEKSFCPAQLNTSRESEVIYIIFCQPLNKHPWPNG